jgi:hypothetical protein
MGYDKKNKNSSVTRENRDEQAAAAIIERRKNRGGGEIADWGSADPTLIGRAVSLATRKGASITFGYTRDGGAMRLSLFAGGKQTDDYIRPTESVDDFLTAFIQDFQ